MRKGKFLVVLVSFLFVLSSFAGANGLNLNGIGSRALSMGGAFVGLADDFTAVYWNPAGIGQFNKSVFGVFAEGIIPKQKYQLAVYGIDAQSKNKIYPTGMISYFQPVTDNIVAGISVYTPSGLGSAWNGADFAPLTFGNTYEWESLIGVVTIAPAVAVNIGDYVSVGAALNINYGFLDLKRHAGSQELMFDLGQQEMDIKGWGYGATFGILVKPSDKFSIGATFRTPSKIKFSGDATVSNLDQLGPMYQTTIATESEMDGDITWPMWLAAGIAVKPVENLTLTADVQYTHWSEIDVIIFEFTDQMWMNIFEPMEANQMKLHWDNATQIRFGAEYKFNNLALRAGYYIDPAPAPDETMNVLLPSHDFDAFGFGIGYAKNGLHIDLSGEYLFGKDRDIGLQYLPDAMPGIYQLNILAFTGSVSFGW